MATCGFCCNKQNKCAHCLEVSKTSIVKLTRKLKSITCKYMYFASNKTLKFYDREAWEQLVKLPTSISHVYITFLILSQKKKQTNQPRPFHSIARLKVKSSCFLSHMGVKHAN